MTANQNEKQKNSETAPWERPWEASVNVKYVSSFSHAAFNATSESGF